MTSILEGRDALGTLLDGAGVVVTDAPGATDPPVVTLFCNGMDPAETMRDGTTWFEYRIVCIASGWDQDGAAAQLAGVVASTVAAVWASPDYILGRVSGDRAVRIGGADRLAADVYAKTKINLTA